MIPSGPWRPYEWYYSRDGEEMWVGAKLDHDPVVVGPRIVPPNATGGPGSASNTDAARGRFMGAGPWPTGEYYVWDKEKASICNPDAGDSSIPYRHLSSLEEANTAANALNRGMVAPPGPTAGDVDVAHELAGMAPRMDGPLEAEFSRRIAAALVDKGKAARAELLAQIREPSDELIEATAMAAAETEDPGSWARLAETNLRLCKHDYREMQRSALRVLADKLTEAE